MIDAETMEQVRQQLSSRAELFEDPGTYLDGVQDALDALQELEGEAPAAASTGPDPLRLIEAEDAGAGLSSDAVG